MTALFFAALVIVSAAFLIAAQYVYEGWLTLGYALTLTAVCAAYLLYERSKRKKLTERVTRIFKGEFDAPRGEDELSELEREVALSVKNGAAMDAKIAESYKNIASLVSDISHQCKTPLSSVLMYSEMPPDANSQAVIHAQAKKLSFLLDALTKLSRCEGGLITENLKPAQHEVSALICRVVTDCMSGAENKSIDIVSDVAYAVSARFDMSWTSEALFNILDNAVKYSPEGSTISIRASEYEMFVRIDVRDNGAGIPEAEQSEIWKRFYRGKNAGENSGVGIGLYLTRAILSAEGGRAAVKSELGHGSVFSVYLPKL